MVSVSHSAPVVALGCSVLERIDSPLFGFRVGVDRPVLLFGDERLVAGAYLRRGSSELLNAPAGLRRQPGQLLAVLYSVSYTSRVGIGVAGGVLQGLGNGGSCGERRRVLVLSGGEFGEPGGQLIATSAAAATVTELVQLSLNVGHLNRGGHRGGPGG